MIPNALPELLRGLGPARTPAPSPKGDDDDDAFSNPLLSASDPWDAVYERLLVAVQSRHLFVLPAAHAVSAPCSGTAGPGSPDSTRSPHTVLTAHRPPNPGSPVRGLPLQVYGGARPSLGPLVVHTATSGARGGWRRAAHIAVTFLPRSPLPRPPQPALGLGMIAVLFVGPGATSVRIDDTRTIPVCPLSHDVGRSVAV